MQEQPVKLWTRPFVTVTALNLLLFFGFQMLMPLIPLHLKTMGASDSMIGLIAGIFTLSTLSIRPFSGIALDRIGKKQTLLVGLIIFIVMVVSYSYLPTLGLFFLFRFIHGFGWGACTTSTSTIASGLLPRKRFAEGMGYFGLSNGIGMAVGPATGLFLILNISFRNITMLTAILTVLAFILTLTLPKTNIPKKEHIQSSEKGSWFERGAIRPGIVMMFVTITYGSIISFLSLYASDLGIENIGIFYTLYAAVMLLTRPISGRIIDRYGFDRPVITGLVCIAAALVFLWKAQSMPAFLIAAVFYGIGFGTTQPSLQTMAVRDVKPNRLGAANATFFIGFDLGIGLGSMLFGRIAQWIGYSNMYLTAIGFSIIGIVLYIALNKRNRTA